MNEVNEDNSSKTKGTESRFKTLNIFCDRIIKDSNLTFSAIAVFIIIYRHGKNGKSFVTVTQIADYLNTSRRTVYNALKALEIAKLIARETTAKDGKYFIYVNKKRE